MKLEFKRPLVANFIKTDKGSFDIRDLDKEELEEYKIVVCNAIEDNWRRRLHGADRERKELKNLK